MDNLNPCEARVCKRCGIFFVAEIDDKGEYCNNCSPVMNSINCSSCVYKDNFTYESPCSHCNRNPKYSDCYQKGSD